MNYPKTSKHIRLILPTEIKAGDSLLLVYQGEPYDPVPAVAYLTDEGLMMLNIEGGLRIPVSLCRATIYRVEG
jgi:hypothetical protein